MIRTHVQPLFPALLVVTIAATLTGCGSEQKAEEAAPAAVVAAPVQPLSVEESARVNVTARVKAVDQTTRVVTLEDSTGRTVTLVAGSDVRRLNEVMPGDTVSVEYVVSLLAELRPPTAGEAANPIAAVDVVGRAPQSDAPAGGVARAVRVVTTIQALDKANMLVTLRGPGGDTATVRSRKAENFARLHVGDTVVITYTETAVIALEKAAR